MDDMNQKLNNAVFGLNTINMALKEAGYDEQVIENTIQCLIWDMHPLLKESGANDQEIERITKYLFSCVERT